MDFNATTNSSDEFNSSQHLNAGKYPKVVQQPKCVSSDKLTGFIQVKHIIYLTSLG